MLLYLTVNISTINFQRQFKAIQDNKSVRMGGNCLLQMLIEVSSVLNVSESEFINGIAEEIPLEAPKMYLPPGGGGFGVYINQVAPTIASYYQTQYYRVSIVKCKFINNSAAVQLQLCRLAIYDTLLHFYC